MPISATGAIEIGAITPVFPSLGCGREVSAWSRHRLRDSGFSLIELLVVLVILGSVLGAVLLASGGSEERRLENAARRAELLIASACERAMVTGVDIGFRIEPEQLRFGYLRPSGWAPIAKDPGDELRPRLLGQGLALQGLRDGVPLAAEDSPGKAQFACTAAGELSPFVLEIAIASQPPRWRLSGDFTGRLQLEPISARAGQ